jgi:hypothetical protein
VHESLHQSVHRPQADMRTNIGTPPTSAKPKSR